MEPSFFCVFMGGLLSFLVLQISGPAQADGKDMCRYTLLDPACVIAWLHQFLGIAPLCCLWPEAKKQCVLHTEHFYFHQQFYALNQNKVESEPLVTVWIDYKSSSLIAGLM